MSVHRGARVGQGVVLATSLAAALAGCGATAIPSASDDTAWWKASASVETVTAAPDAGGVLSYRNCPTLDEARAALPAIVDGPDANGVPFKSMVLQCSYRLPGSDISGRPAGVGLLVFDAVAEGRTAWDWTLDGDSGTPTAIPALGDRGFATHAIDRWDVWVSASRFGIHLSHTSRDDLALDPLAGLARAAVVGLDRPPR
jgi:hypothetical protein